MATILVTGFGPFPGAPVNPTRLLVTQLARMRTPRLRGHKIATHVFETSYAAVDRDLPRLVAKHRPRLIVLFGLAANTPHLRIETRAYNEIARQQVDVAGKVPDNIAIRPARAQALRGRVPFTRLVAAARAAGMKAQCSHDAGSYVCNYVYWRAIEAAQKPGGVKRVVFIHVPELRTGHWRGSLRGLPLLVRAAQATIIAAMDGLSPR